MADVHNRDPGAKEAPQLPDIPKERYLKKYSGTGAPNFEYLKEKMGEKMRKIYSRSESPKKK